MDQGSSTSSTLTFGARQFFCAAVRRDCHMLCKISSNVPNLCLLDACINPIRDGQKCFQMFPSVPLRAEPPQIEDHIYRLTQPIFLRDRGGLFVCLCFFKVLSSLGVYGGLVPGTLMDTKIHRYLSPLYKTAWHHEYSQPSPRRWIYPANHISFCSGYGGPTVLTRTLACQVSYLLYYCFSFS